MLKRALFTLIALGIGLAGAELAAFVGLEILLYRAKQAARGVDTSASLSMDPNLGTLLVPGQCLDFPYGMHDRIGSFVEDVPDWRLCTNSLGWRGPEFDPEKPGDTFRLVCMGDSNTMGQSVEYEDLFCPVLGARLAPLVESAGLRMEVINAGVWGHSSMQGLISWEKFVRAWEPDLVTVGYGANDHAPLAAEGMQLRDRVTYSLPGETPGASLVPYSDRDLHVVRLAKVALRTVQERRYAAVRDTAAPEGDVPYAARRSTPLEYEENLGRLLDRIREDGAEVALLGVGLSDRTYRRVQRQVAEARGIPYLPAWELFDALEPAVRSGELYAEERDLIEPLLTEKGRSVTRHWSRYLTADGGHPNLIGHRIIADALYELLADRVAERVGSGAGPAS